MPSAPTEVETQHPNDSSEEVSRQLLGGSSYQAPAAETFDKDVGDLDSRFALPPPPLDNPGSPPRSLPSVPDIPTSPSLSSRNGQHPSAPPDLPDFSSFTGDAPSGPISDPRRPPSLPSQPPTSVPAQRPNASRSVPPPASVPPAASAPVSEAWQPEPNNIDPMVISAAQKHAKWAISALNYEDLETAKVELRKALSLIGG